MGNSLCRERIARADNSKNPIDRIIGRCAQICPANEVKSNYWQKHVLETGPPTRSQPQSALGDGWRKVTLTVPNGKTSMSGGDLGETPIAPPRRKRSSVIDRQPCGFKELFGNNVSRRSSCDSVLRDEPPMTEREQEILQQKRKSKSISDFNLNEMKPTNSLSISTIRIPVTRTLSLMERSMVQQTTISTPRPILQRKVSRVGNKNSDKFFGENLSDCLSDDPITPELEPTSISFTYNTISTLITPIPHSMIDGQDKANHLSETITAANDSKDENSNEVGDISIPIPKPFIISDHIDAETDVGNRKTSLDKKAEFLMAMLEGTNISYGPPAEPKIMTPPRRSHLKKKSSQITTDNGNPIINIESIDVTDKSGIENEPIEQTEAAVEKKNVSNNDKGTGTMIEMNVNNDDDYYKGMTPVEEPLIVPRRRSTKHICDGGGDHHHTHKTLENSHDGIISNETENKENESKILSKESAADVEKYIIQQVTSIPDKPKRDFSAYEKTHTNKMDQLSGKIEKPLPRVRHLSQENLMSKKCLKGMSNDTIDLLRLKTMQNNNSVVNKLNENGPLDATLKKYTSQQSFFTEEILSQIADRVYGFQDPFDTLESDDGSLKCTPHSKLTTRKITAHRKESTITRPILENDVEIDGAPPKVIQMEQKELPSSSSPIQNMQHVNKTTIDELNRKSSDDKHNNHVTDTFISIEREHSAVCDTTEMKTNKNVILNEPNTNNTEARATMTHENHIEHDNHHVLDDIYKVNNTILDDFQKNFNNSTMLNEQIINDSKLENGNSSEDENTTDSDTTVKEVPVANNDQTDIDIENQMLKRLNGGEKRGSIVEVDAWFLKHNDLSDLPRRGSDCSNGYDTRKVFPFGKSDPFQMKLLHPQPIIQFY